MFTINKSEIHERHYFAYAGVVKEEIGIVQDYEAGSNYFPIVNKSNAIEYSFMGKIRELSLDYKRYKYSKYTLYVYRFRSIWNLSLRNSLRSYLIDKELSKDALDSYTIKDVEVKEITENINIDGKRCQIGTNFWTVNNYSMLVEQEIVKKESFIIYSNKNTAYYSSGRSGFSSTEYEKGIFERSGNWYFFDKKSAVEYASGLLRNKLDALNLEQDTLNLQINKEPLIVVYTNWRSETSQRKLLPMSVWYGTTEYHKTPQWFMKAKDVNKDVVRDFAILDFDKFISGNADVRLEN